MRTRTRLQKIIFGLFHPEFSEPEIRMDAPHLRIFVPDTSPDDDDPPELLKDRADST